MVRILRTRDGRTLAFAEFGDPDGRPVFSLHGMPGSRIGPHPRQARLHPQNIRLIAYDRPGYGASDRHEGRTVAAAAADVEDLADELGIEHFAVIGRSGGGPHALACAALLPERVTRVAVLSGYAPRALMGEPWYEGMIKDNSDWYREAERGIEAYTAYVAAEMNRRRIDPEFVMPHRRSELPKADRAAVLDHGIRSRMLDNIAEALRNGVDGWIDDNLALVTGWGFEIGHVGLPVLLWHGAEDTIAPAAHSRYLARAIPRAEFRLAPGGAHLSAIEALPGLLAWLTRFDRRTGARRPDVA